MEDPTMHMRSRIHLFLVLMVYGDRSESLLWSDALYCILLQGVTRTVVEGSFADFTVIIKSLLKSDIPFVSMSPSEMWKSMSGMAEKLTIGFGAEGFTPISQAELTEQFSRIEAELRQLTRSNQRLDEEYSFSEE